METKHYLLVCIFALAEGISCGTDKAYFVCFPIGKQKQNSYDTEQNWETSQIKGNFLSESNYS